VAAAPVVAEALEPRELLTTYYVSTGGVDANPGTLAAPFRTIQKAANAAIAGDTVLVRAGTYRETVRVPRSGTAAAPITFQAYPGEQVTVSGADVVGGWSNYRNAIYQARQSWDLGFGLNQVFLDGRMMIEARWPNTTLDVSRPTKASIDSATAVTDLTSLISTANITDAALTQAAGFWTGAAIHFVPGQGWAGQTGTVTASSPGKLTFTYTQRDAQAPVRGNAYYLTGKFTALDAAGEWYRDPATKQLYLWGPNSDNPAAHVVEAKRRAYAFDLRDRDYVNITGFNIFAATIVSNPNSSYLRLSRLNAKYLSHWTVQATGWSQPNETGIYLAGTNNSITDSQVAYSAGHGIMVNGTNSRVENNVVRDVAYNAGDSAGIRTAGSGHVVTGNTVYNCARSGIKISNTTQVRVTNNEVHDCLLQTTDGGGIYTFAMDGTGSEIAYNRVYNVTSGGWGGVGIFLDNNSTNWLVHHNVVWNVTHGMKMNYAATNNRVLNNTLAGLSSSISTSSNADFTGTVIRNNIFTKGVRFGVGVTADYNLKPGTDAKFVDASRGDFQLQSASPAVNKALAVAPLTNGYVGAAPDMGALEYGRPAFSAGARLAPAPTPPPPPPPPPAPVPPGTVDARGRIEAESYTDANGTIVRGPTNIGSLDSGEWVKYGPVDFGAGGITKFIARLAVSDTAAGKTMEVRVGSPTGTVIGSLRTTTTGGWSTYADQTATLTAAVTGVQDVYLVFKGGAVAVLDSFTFA
jgi:parallel beta-helix repeat protein